MSNPDFVTESRRSADTHPYYKAIQQMAIRDGIVVPFEGYMVVVVTMSRKSVLTAYMSDRKKKGRLKWKP